MQHGHILKNGFNQVIGQGQGQIDQKMVHDTPPFQDASLHQIWDSPSQLIEEICYGQDSFRNEVRGQDQLYSRLNMVGDTPPAQDTSIHRTWDS